MCTCMKCDDVVEHNSKKNVCMNDRNIASKEAYLSKDCTSCFLFSKNTVDPSIDPSIYTHPFSLHIRLLFSSNNIQNLVSNHYLIVVDNVYSNQQSDAVVEHIPSSVYHHSQQDHRHKN